MTHHASTCPATPPRARSAPTRSPTAHRDRRRGRRPRDPRWCATAPAACSGSSRWSRSRPSAAASRYGPVAAGRRRRPGRRPACSTAPTPTCSLGRDRRASSGCATSSGVTFARVGVIDPLSADDYEAHGGLRRPARGPGDDAGARSSTRSPSPVCAAAAARASPPASSGRPCSARRPTLKFVCCNADEGDSGTFADRMLMEGDPFTLIEGMTIAAYAVGATRGLRLPPLRVPGRGRHAAARRSTSPTPTAGSARSILGSGLTFDLDVRVGAGAYICGEETSMLESLEGKRGMVRAKPPIPALDGPVRQADRGQQRAHARHRCR